MSDRQERLDLARAMTESTAALAEERGRWTDLFLAQNEFNLEITDAVLKIIEGKPSTVDLQKLVEALRTSTAKARALSLHMNGEVRAAMEATKRAIDDAGPES